MRLVSEDDLAAVLERQLNIRCIALHDRKPEPGALEALSADMAKHYTVFPIRVTGKTLTLAMVDPLDIPTIDDLQFRLGLRIVPALALESEILRAISVYYDGVVPDEEPQRRRYEDKSAVGSETVAVETMPRKASEKAESAERTEGHRQPPTHKEVLEALVDILIEKGVVTKEELLRRLKEPS